MRLDFDFMQAEQRVALDLYVFIIAYLGIQISLFSLFLHVCLIVNIIYCNHD